MTASHGWWCGARTFPIKCKDYGQRVFYFSCDCGSKRLFNRLGGLWPEHRCRNKAWLKFESGSEVIPVDEFYARTVQEATQEKEHFPEQSPPKWHPRINPTEHNSLTTKEGIVTELIWNVGIMNKIGKNFGTVGRAMLGQAAKGKQAQVTIHTTALAEVEEDRGSYTFYVKESTVKSANIVRGCCVVASLRGIVLSKNHPIWVCDQLIDVLDTI